MNKISKLFVIVLTLFMTACSTLSHNDSRHVDEARVVTDVADRIVELPADIQTIAILYAPAAHVLTLFGHGDKIVAAPGGIKREKLIMELVPTLADVVTPKENGQTNVEELASVRPDLIFINEKMLLDEGERNKFEQLNIPYVVVDFLSIEQQVQTIRLIGQILNEQDKAEQYISYYEEMISLVEERIEDVPKDERIDVYHSVNEATRTSERGSLTAEWMELIGINNVALTDELKQYDGKYYASVEQIYIWNPAVILVSENGVDDYIRNKEQWKNIDAVKNDDVYMLPIGLTRWGHPSSMEVPLAMLWTAKLLYPERFADIRLEDEVSKYYEQFYALSLTKEQINDILTGREMRQRKEIKE